MNSGRMWKRRPKNRLKKNAEALIAQEREAEIARVLQIVRKESALDLEALEFFIRSQSLDFGAAILEKALKDVGEGARDEPLFCANNHLPCRMESQGRQTKTIRTVLGPISFTRSVFRCPQCGAIRRPGDEALGVIGTGFSPGTRRTMARAGSQESFEIANAIIALRCCMHSHRFEQFWEDAA